MCSLWVEYYPWGEQNTNKEEWDSTGQSATRWVPMSHTIRSLLSFPDSIYKTTFYKCITSSYKFPSLKILGTFSCVCVDAQAYSH